MAFSKTDTTVTVSTTELSLLTGGSTLTPSTTFAVVQVFVDVSAMAAGDQYQFVVYEKIGGSGSAESIIYQSVLTGAQPTPWVSPALLLSDGWLATAKKLAGTDRQFKASTRLSS